MSAKTHYTDSPDDHFACIHPLHLIYDDIYLYAIGHCSTVVIYRQEDQPGFY
ncbi:hypothetical protein ACEQPO_04670 [Bacillus sp. SL00103]